MPHYHLYLHSAHGYLCQLGVQTARHICEQWEISMHYQKGFFKNASAIKGDFKELLTAFRTVPINAKQNPAKVRTQRAQRTTHFIL